MKPSNQPSSCGGARREIGGVLLALLLSATVHAQGIITTIAGNGRYFKGDGGPAISAQMGQLAGVAADAAGNVYAADPTNNIVVKVTPSGTIQRIAGNNIAGYSGDGGPATSAALNTPLGVEVDATGNIFIADGGNKRVRRVTPDGVINTVAGNGSAGFSGDGGPATEAILGNPVDATVDQAGNLYISDFLNGRVRKVTLDGIITTVAGNGSATFSGDGGPALDAGLGLVRGIGVDRAGNIYVATNVNRVRKISPDGTITTLAGNGQGGTPAGDGGPAVDAVVPTANSLYADLDGNVYISNGWIRKIDTNGVITRFAGGGTNQGDGGPALSGNFSGAQGIAFGAGSFFVSETATGRIRKIDSKSILSTIAGTSLENFAGDNGPSATAQLSLPNGLALDTRGNLYIADTNNNRIRRIATDGKITTVAGNGRTGFSGDGGQATNAALNAPRAVAVDTAGNLYIADSAVNRIRKVTPQGVISTIAGNGQSNVTGDGGPAASAAIGYISSLALDTAGNLYLGSNTVNRVRKISTSGIITAVAGTGIGALGGEGIPAVDSPFLFVFAIAVDGTGSIYISEFGRIRKVTPDGIVNTIAGGAPSGMFKDNAPAIESFFVANGIAVDTSGIIYLAGGNLHNIAKITPDGILHVIAGLPSDTGVGIAGFAGDGGQAKIAQMNMPSGIVLDPAGNIYFTDTNNDRLRVILAAPPAFSAAPTTVAFTTNAGVTDVFPKQITVASPVSQLPWSASSSGGDWLSISPKSGSTPANIDVSVNTLGLSPGTYRGTVTVTAPDATPRTQSVAVSLVINAINPPRLSVQTSGISFALNTGSVTGTNQFTVANAGSGSVDFSITTATDSGGRWLNATPVSGNVTGATPSTITATANPSGLNAGTYTGRIAIASASTGQTITVPVTMTVTGVRQSILLSQTGLTFTAVAGGGAVPSQSFGILNTKQGQMNWSVVTSTLSGGANWLSATPTSGASEANSLKVPLVDVAIRPAGLAAGEYYGQVRVSAPGADNSPQLVSVVLKVLPARSTPPPLVRPTGLIFTSLSGASPPGSQDVLVSNLTNTPLTFSSGRLTLDGKDWFVSIPPSDTVTSASPTRLTVQTDTRGLTAGIRRGALTLLFSDGGIQTVNLLSVLLGGPGSKNVSPAVGCSPTTLLPLLTSFGPNFSVPAGWPAPVEARIVDDCGEAMETGSVVASFSNGDPPVSLVRLGEGKWSGTWQPRSPQSGVTVTVTAQIPEGRLKGVSQVTGGLQTNDGVPVVAQAALVNAASFGPLALVSPGSIISIFGSKLSDTAASATTLPLPTQLGGVSVLMSGQLLPLIYVSGGQVNAVVPYGISVNAQQQVLIQRGTSYSVPEPVTVAQSQPAIFTRDQSGKGQGLIVKGVALADASNPVQAGDVVVVYGTGLGEVSPAVLAGAPAPTSPLARVVVPVEARVGGQTAPVLFAGLVPGFVGLYQVNVQIPTGVSPGAAVPFVLLQNNVPSNTVSLTVR